MRLLLKQFFEFPRWEGIFHVIFALLLIYVIYAMCRYKKHRTVLNILLLSIACGIDVLIHQQVNIKNNVGTQYL